MCKLVAITKKPEHHQNTKVKMVGEIPVGRPRNGLTEAPRRLIISYTKSTVKINRN